MKAPSSGLRPASPKGEGLSFKALARMAGEGPRSGGEGLELIKMKTPHPPCGHLLPARGAKASCTPKRGINSAAINVRDRASSPSPLTEFRPRLLQQQGCG